MTDKDINSLLFRGVIATMDGLLDSDHSPMSDTSDMGVTFYKGYQPRNDVVFHHNYERDMFLKKRDEYVVLNKGRAYVIVLKKTKQEEITIYSQPFKELFPDDHERLVKVLEKLLHKFYDNIRVESRNGLPWVDISSSTSPNHIRIVNEV